MMSELKKVTRWEGEYKGFTYEIQQDGEAWEACVHLDTFESKHLWANIPSSRIYDDAHATPFGYPEFYIGSRKVNYTARTFHDAIRVVNASWSFEHSPTAQITVEDVQRDCMAAIDDILRLDKPSE